MELENLLAFIEWDHHRLFLDSFLIDAIEFDGFYIAYEEWSEEVNVDTEQVLSPLGPMYIGGVTLHTHQFLTSSECADIHIISDGTFSENEFMGRLKEIAPKNLHCFL